MSRLHSGIQPASRRTPHLRPSIVVLVLIAVSVFSASPADTLMREVPFEEMVVAAGDIIEGTVVSQHSYRSDNGFTNYTDVLIRVTEPVAGSLRRGDLLTVTVEGGVVGDMGIMVEHQPRFRTDERVLLFLRAAPTLKADQPAPPRSVLHLEQGKFLIVDETIINYRGETEARGSFRERVQTLLPTEPD